MLDRYLHPHLGAHLVADLTTADLDDLYVRLRRSGGIGGKQLQPGTLARTHVELRSSLGQAIRWGWIWDNLAERAQMLMSSPYSGPSMIRSWVSTVALMMRLAAT